MLSKFTLNKTLTLNLIPTIEIVIGLTMLIGYDFYHIEFTQMLEVLMPIHLWCAILILGSLIGFYAKRRIVYIASVSVPILLYASILLRSFLENTGASPHSFIVYFILGIASIHFSVKEMELWI